MIDAAKSAVSAGIVKVVDFAMDQAGISGRAKDSITASSKA